MNIDKLLSNILRNNKFNIININIHFSKQNRTFHINASLIFNGKLTTIHASSKVLKKSIKLLNEKITAIHNFNKNFKISNPNPTPKTLNISINK